MSRRSRIRWMAPLAVGAAAALIAVGAVALSDRESEQPGGAPPAGEPAERTVPLDLGPLTEAEAREVLGPGLTDIMVHYARRIDGPDGSISIVVGTSDSGITVFSTRYLDTNPEFAESTQPIRGVEHPWGPTMADHIYRDLPGYWKLAGLYRVADTVDRVEVRVGTPDGPEPWRVAEPHNGYVYWATWFKFADYEPGTELTVEWRFFDTDGEQIDMGMPDPDQPQTVTVPDPAH